MKKNLSLVFILIFLLPSILLAQTSQPFSTTEDETPICHWSRELILSYLQYTRVVSSQRAEAISASATANDPYYNSSNSWNQGYDDMWGLKRINIEDAWTLSTGLGVTIAVIDSGIDYNHVDINDNIWTNTVELNGLPGVDDDGNGYIDDVRGWDFYYQDNDPADGNGHGTHVAGIIAAERDNGEGIVGIAYQSKVMAVKVLNDSGSTSYYDRLAAGIRYAVDMGAKVLNCSFGGSLVSVLADAIQYAFNKGAIIIAAAGNGGGQISDYPATSNNVITVGSMNQGNTRSSFSAYGSQLDVVAPGEDILSLRASGTNASGDSSKLVPQGDPGAGYLRLSGTSMATPLVSGLTALMFAQDPDLTFEEFARRLRFSSDDFGAAGWDDYYGWGRIDAFAALSHDWYDSGNIRTWWLTAPDPDNITRYDYYETGETMSRWLAAPDLDKVFRYDYFISGILQSKWLATPDLDNVIRYSFYESGRLDSKWLDAPDANGNTRYGYYNEDTGGGAARIYLIEDSAGTPTYSYAYIPGTDTAIIKYEENIFSVLGGGTSFLYYDNGSIFYKKIEFENGGSAEVNILPDNKFQITKFNYGATIGNNAWFLWGENAYKGYSNVVIEYGHYLTEATIGLGMSPSKAILSPDGEYAYVTNEFSHNVSVINTATNCVTGTIAVGNTPMDIVITPNGSHLYVGNFNSNSVSVIDASTNSVIKTISVGSAPGHLSISPDGQYVYVSNRNSNTVSVISTANNSVVKTISTGRSPWEVVFAPDSQRAYIANSDSGTINVVNTVTNSVVATITVGGYPGPMAITPDGMYLYSVSGSLDSVIVIDTSTNSVIKTISAGNGASSIVITPDGKYAYVVNCYADSITVIDTVTNSATETICVGDIPGSITLSPDGKYLYVANRNSDTVSVVNTVTNRVETVVKTGDDPYNIAIAPDGSHLYAVNSQSRNLTKINLNYCWQAYSGFTPDITHPENVIDPTGWQLIEEISDPASIQNLLPELGGWRNWCVDHNIVPEFPPVASVINPDGSRVDYNPAIVTMTSYRSGTDEKYQVIYLEGNGQWVMSAQYFNDGVTPQYMWLADEDSNKNGNYVYAEHDVSGRIILKRYDTGESITYIYDGSSTTKLYEIYISLSGEWQKTIQCRDDGATMHYQWLADANPSQAGDTVYEEYDAQGRIINKILDSGERVLYQYDGASTTKLYEIYISSSGQWQKTIQYYTGGTTMRYQWLADANQSQPGDTVYEEYDTNGICIYRLFDDGSTWTPGSKSLLVQNTFVTAVDDGTLERAGLQDQAPAGITFYPKLVTSTTGLPDELK